ncbi:hypothetical protein [Bradyrhizobium sp. USDA 4529]
MARMHRTFNFISVRFETWTQLLSATGCNNARELQITDLQLKEIIFPYSMAGALCAGASGAAQAGAR